MSFFTLFSIHKDEKIPEWDESPQTNKQTNAFNSV